jgi:hypothetical protein
MGLDRAKGMDGMLQEGKTRLNSGRTRLNRQEVLERSKQTVGIIKD